MIQFKLPKPYDAGKHKIIYKDDMQVALSYT